MSASDNSRPNHEKYQARNVAATKSIARNRIGFEPGTAISGRIDLIKHKINDHTGNRHIEPERQRNPRDTPVSPEVVAKRTVEGQRDKWNNHNREDRVACKDREVNRSRETGALKTRRAVVVVISEIGCEKQQRNYQCRYLTRTMCGNIVRLDKSPT